MSTFTLSVEIFSRLASVTKTVSGSVTLPALPRGPSSTRPENPYLTVTRPFSIWHSRAVLVISPRCMTARPSPTRPVSKMVTLPSRDQTLNRGQPCATSAPPVAVPPGVSDLACANSVSAETPLLVEAVSDGLPPSRPPPIPDVRDERPQPATASPSPATSASLPAV